MTDPEQARHTDKNTITEVPTRRISPRTCDSTNTNPDIENKMDIAVSRH